MLKRNIMYEKFKDYPETITVKQMREMLGDISKYTAFKLINEEKIQCTKIARVYRISKNSVIEYMIENNIWCKKIQYKNKAFSALFWIST